MRIDIQLRPVDTATPATVPPTSGRPDPLRAARPSAGRPNSRRDGRFHLGRVTRKIVLTVHVLSSVGWFGVALTVAFCGLVAANTGDATLPAALYETMRTAVWLSVPIGVLAAASGVVLSLGTKWGLTRYWWVMIKEVITVAVIVTDPLVLVPAIKDAIDGDAASLFEPMIAHCVMLTVATVLSMFKPLGRTRWHRRRLVSGGVPTS